MSCPLCRSEARAKVVFHSKPKPLVRCPQCGLVRVDPMPTRTEALGQYDDDYFKDPVHGYVDYLADEPVFRAEFRRRLRTIRAAGGRGRLLDVGCATGALLLEARAQGFVPSGIEPAEETARRAHARTRMPVRASSIEDALLDRAWYGVITLFDVLEHLVDPVATLAKLRVALRQDGLLAVTVPDLGSWWARASGKRWPMITPWEHLTYYTRRTLTRMLHAAGYARVRFHAARTPLSLRTLAAHVTPAAWIPPVHKELSLPFGTLFALAER
ncbi:MAG: methyltransferase domain-containing protein [Planctomycetota bacterium]|nr:methyltransferase domain-containing protein [Planctomycetota bacterium]